MDKYKATQEEKFKDGEKRTISKDEMQKAKARVKDALNRVQEEENSPRTELGGGEYEGGNGRK